MATGPQALFAKCKGQKFLWPYTIRRGRAAGVVDTSVNKVYVKLDWTKTTIKLNPCRVVSLRALLVRRRCRGSGEGARRVWGVIPLHPYPAFLTKIYSFNFLFASTLLKKSFCFLPISSVLCFSRGRGLQSVAGREVVYFVSLPNTTRVRQHLISRLIAHKTNFVRACFLSLLATPTLSSPPPFKEIKLLYSSDMHSMETDILPVHGLQRKLNFT
jgi:hypothetical protein